MEKLTEFVRKFGGLFSGRRTATASDDPELAEQAIAAERESARRRRINAVRQARIAGGDQIALWEDQAQQDTRRVTG